MEGMERIEHAKDTSLNISTNNSAYMDQTLYYTRLSILNIDNENEKLNVKAQVKEEKIHTEYINRQLEVYNKHEKEVTAKSDKLLNLQQNTDTRDILHELDKYITKRKDSKWLLNNDKYRHIVNDLTQKRNQNLSNDNSNSNWNKIREKSLSIYQKVIRQDKEMIDVRKHATLQTLEAEINALLKDSNWFTDSSKYRDVLDSAKSFKNKKTIIEKLNSLPALKNSIQQYVNAKFQPNYLTSKGERRMNRMSRLEAMISQLENRTLLRDHVLVEFNKRTTIKNKYSKLGKILSSKNPHITSIKEGDWWKLMLLYIPNKPNADSDFKKKNQANLLFNQYLNQALMTQDRNRRLAAMCGLFAQLNLCKINENFFDIKNIENTFVTLRNSYYANIFATKCFQNLLEEGHSKIWGRDNQMLRYMIDRLQCKTRSYLWETMIAYEKKHGFDESRANCINQTNRVSDDESNKIYQAKLDQDIKTNLDLARIMFENQQYVQEDSDMEKKIQATYEKIKNSIAIQMQNKLSTHKLADSVVSSQAPSPAPSPA